MKRKHGWFQIGSGLALSLLFLMAVPACTRPFIEVKVDAQCGPSAALSDDDPKGTPCKKKPGGGCLNVPSGCTCS